MKSLTKTHDDKLKKIFSRHLILTDFSKYFCLVFLFVCIASSAGYAKAYPAAEPKTDSFDRLEKLSEFYNIEILTMFPDFPVKTRHGNINGINAEKAELENYINIFSPELGLYPRSLVKASQLKRIVLCKELSFNGQRRNAIPDFEHDTLYLEVSRGANNKNYLRKVIHHDFFHLIDYRDDGLVYGDEQWSLLNPPDFKYGTGGINAQSVKESSLLSDKFPGFLNYYSTTGVEEDKAELFTHLMVIPTEVENRIKSDRVLAAKVNLLKRLLHKFCPEIDEQFWKNIPLGRPTQTLVTD